MSIYAPSARQVASCIYPKWRRLGVRLLVLVQILKFIKLLLLRVNNSLVCITYCTFCVDNYPVLIEIYSANLAKSSSSVSQQMLMFLELLVLFNNSKYIRIYVYARYIALKGQKLCISKEKQMPRQRITYESIMRLTGTFGTR